MMLTCPYCDKEWTVVESNSSFARCPICNKLIIYSRFPEKLPHEILKDIVDIYGEEIVGDQLRLQGILSDVFPQKTIRKMILFAVADNIPRKIRGCVNNDLSIGIVKLKYFFSTQNFLYREIADYIIDSFAFALGVKTDLQGLDVEKIKSYFISANEGGFSVYEQVLPARIIELKSDNKQIFINQPFKIEWKAQNYTQAFINGEEISPANTQLEYTINGYQQFNLLVANQYYTDSRTLEIEPIRPPEILEFNADHKKVCVGGKVLLTWKVKEAGRIILKSLYEKEIEVSNKEVLEITLEKSDEFEIIAYSNNSYYSVISHTIKVEVVKPVEIISFESDKDRIIESDKIKLKWKVLNATRIVLLPINREVTNEEQVECYLTYPVKLILQAGNEFYVKEKCISIYVKRLPKFSQVCIPAFENNLPTYEFPKIDCLPVSGQLKRVEDIEALTLSKEFFSLKRVLRKQYGKLVMAFNFSKIKI